MSRHCPIHDELKGYCDDCMLEHHGHDKMVESYKESIPEHYVHRFVDSRGQSRKTILSRKNRAHLRYQFEEDEEEITPEDIDYLNTNWEGWQGEDEDTDSIVIEEGDEYE